MADIPEGYPFSTDLVEGVTYLTCVPLTRRQVRRINRDIRNGTDALFDEHQPPVLRPGYMRMRGARQAYERRKSLMEGWR